MKNRQEKMSRVIIVLLMSTTLAFPQIIGHQDWQKLPRRCQSCHVGHGIPGTTMLPLAEEDFCFQCHGDASELDKAIRNNLILSNVKMKNMRRVFRKPHHHPVELKTHQSQEYLSGKDNIYAFTRAECLDCHRGHGVTKFEYSAGISSKRSTKDEKEFEYQLCYKCHATIIQSSLAKRNIKDWFATSNPSYHPLEAAGKNSDVPSLKKPYSAAGVINCTDCHNNDEPAGPRGPHGSEYEYLLERNYSLKDNLPESKQQYELCYKCHDRDSILRDESFPLHSRHIVLVKTSCFTCHHSHGSQRSTHLIKFNEDTDPFVIQSSSSGRLDFFDNGKFSGECYLTCHGINHNPKQYDRR